MPKDEGAKGKITLPETDEDGRTSIQCMFSTRELLKAMCVGKESYDRALLRIMQGYKDCRCEWIKKSAPRKSGDLLWVVFDLRTVKPNESLRDFIMKNVTEQLQRQGIDLDSRVE
jgi:hypothetical protein